MAWENYTGYDEVMNDNSNVKKNYSGSSIYSYDKENVSVTFSASGENEFYNHDSSTGLDLRRNYTYTNEGSTNFVIESSKPIIRSCAYFYNFNERIERDLGFYTLTVSVFINYITEDMVIKSVNFPLFSGNATEGICLDYSGRDKDGNPIIVRPEPTFRYTTSTISGMSSNYTAISNNVKTADITATISIPLFKNREEAEIYLKTGEGEPIEPPSKRNIKSYFPERIDSLSFYSDLRLSDVAVYKEYQSLLMQGKYLEASKFLQDSDAEYFGGYVYNRFQNRILAVERYFVSQWTDNRKMIISGIEPEHTPVGVGWIE